MKSKLLRLVSDVSSHTGYILPSSSSTWHWLLGLRKELLIEHVDPHFNEVIYFTHLIVILEHLLYPRDCVRPAGHARQRYLNNTKTDPHLHSEGWWSGKSTIVRTIEGNKDITTGRRLAWDAKLREGPLRRKLKQNQKDNKVTIIEREKRQSPVRGAWMGGRWKQRELLAGELRNVQSSDRETSREGSSERERLTGRQRSHVPSRMDQVLGSHLVCSVRRPL